MRFEEDSTADRWGEWLGRVAGYLLFTVIFCAIFVYLPKNPHLTLIQAVGITIIIAIVGALTRKALA